MDRVDWTWIAVGLMASTLLVSRESSTSGVLPMASSVELSKDPARDMLSSLAAMPWTAHVRLIRRHMGPDFRVVTPGIRMADAADDDQVRVVTPGKAVEAGASYIVVGRPIIAAPDPAEACRRILDDMRS